MRLRCDWSIHDRMPVILDPHSYAEFLDDAVVRDEGSGTIAANCTKTAAVAQMNLETAVLPN
jgi:putative SOS response-associated peptidase YedK